MIGFWYFVPKSGVAFIGISVLAILIWNGFRNDLPDPYLWIIGFEVFLFIICFLVANREAKKTKIKL